MSRPPEPDPSASDQLRNIYRSGDPTGRSKPDDGSTFTGLLPTDKQRRARQDELAEQARLRERD